MKDLLFIGSNDMNSPPGEINKYAEEYQNGLFIEANPGAYERLKKTLSNANAKHNTNYIAINSLITSEQDKEYPFYIYNQGGPCHDVSSSLYQQGIKLWGNAVRQTGKQLKLKSNTIENILKEHKWENKKYDCIIDTQGAELEVLKGFSMNSLNNIENLTVEASSIEVYKGGVQFNELNNFLTNNGFKSISKPPTGKSFQAHIDVKYIKN